MRIDKRSVYGGRGKVQLLFCCLLTSEVLFTEGLYDARDARSADGRKDTLGVRRVAHRPAVVDRPLPNSVTIRRAKAS